MNKEQITSIIRALGIIIVMIAGMFGLRLDEETGQVIAIGVAMVALLAYSLWKNHNITPAAALAQRVLDLLKEQVLTFEQVEQLIRDAQEEELIRENKLVFEEIGDDQED